jgi:hypothetical protein
MTDTTLTKVYQLAARIKDMAPWRYLYESEIFVVQIPDIDTPYFISVMGSGGEHFGISAYEGIQGLMGFQTIHQAAKWFRPLEMMLIPHMMISFEDRDMVDAKARKKMKELGLSFRGQNAWPDLRHVTPGYVPCMPDEEALLRLVIILEQAIQVFERAESNSELINPENRDDDLFLFRIPSGREPNDVEWKDAYQKIGPQPVSYPMEYDLAERDQVARLPRSSDVLLADIAMLANQISGPGKKDYFASVFIAMSKQSGIVYDFEALTPEGGVGVMHSRFPDLLIKAILKQNWQPAAIEIRHPKFHQMAKAALDPINLKVIHKPAIKQLNHLVNMMERGI